MSPVWLLIDPAPRIKRNRRKVGTAAKGVISSLVCPANTRKTKGKGDKTSILFHRYTQLTLGVNGSGIQADIGAKRARESANMSNEAWVMFKAGVTLPRKIYELALCDSRL